MAKSRRGFASMDAELRREIARRGGKASQERGTGHRWDEAEAKIAGQKGGKATQAGDNAYRFTSKTARAAAQARKKRGR